MFRQTAFLLALFLLLPVVGLTAEPEEIAEKLKQGGLVIVMRHAESPRDPPTQEEAARRNFNLERQLTESGQMAAADMGLSWRSAGIHISAVYTSPAFRAEQTARYAGFSTPQAVIELDSGSASTPEAIEWLQLHVSRRVNLGNRLIITHAGNVSSAFGDRGRALQNGEAMIFEPSLDADGPVLLGRIDINSWPKLLLGD